MENGDKSSTRYYVEPWKSGFCVKMVISNGNGSSAVFYTDHQGLWIRSKVPLVPMKRDLAQRQIDDFFEEDRKISRTWRL